VRQSAACRRGIAAALMASIISSVPPSPQVDAVWVAGP
jgi:hypothetical protein